VPYLDQKSPYRNPMAGAKPGVQHLNLIEGKSQYNHLFSGYSIYIYDGMLVACLNMLIGVKRIIGNWL
jgi:hypothetical protein